MVQYANTKSNKYVLTKKQKKGTPINHLGEVRLLITRYKSKAQCRDTQTSENCVPKGRDIYTEFIEPTIIKIKGMPTNQINDVRFA